MFQDVDITCCSNLIGERPRVPFAIGSVKSAFEWGADHGVEILAKSLEQQFKRNVNHRGRIIAPLGDIVFGRNMSLSKGTLIK